MMKTMTEDHGDEIELAETPGRRSLDLPKKYAFRPTRMEKAMTSKPNIAITDFLASLGLHPVSGDEHCDEAMYYCPLPGHDDHSPSFSVNTKKNVWKCFGCNQGGDVTRLLMLLEGVTQEVAAERLLAMVASNEKPSNSASAEVTSLDQGQGCTLEQVAAAKGISADYLRECGWSTIPWYDGGPAVRILYFDGEGNEKAARFRVALTGDRFRWRKGSKPMPYGLRSLYQARKSGFVFLVEGESDAVTLWRNFFPALGIPGAGTWQPEWATALDGIKTIYVVVEPDQGGNTLLGRLAGSSLADRLKVIRMPEDAKDMNALYLQDPHSFRKAVQDLRDSATTLADETPDIEKARIAASEKAWERCHTLAEQPDILAAFLKEAERQGVVGETQALQVIYLVLTSRLLDHPVSAAVKAPSGTGKSWVVDHVVEHFPDEAYVKLTATSPKALLFTELSLSHRTLVYAEAGGMAEGLGAYLIRSLLSEGHLDYLTVESTQEGFCPRTYKVMGPTSLLVTTTRANLDEELETRLLTIPGDDSPEQTQAVMLANARRRSGPRLIPEDSRPVWHDLQTWLAGANHVVEIPFAEAIAEFTTSKIVGLRRGMNALLGLIESHALLHQASRERTASGNILATYEDYDKVRELVGTLIARRNASEASPELRAVVAAVAELTKRQRPGEEREGILIPAVAAHMGLDQASVKLRVSEGIGLGYLRNVASRGKTRQLRVGEPIPDDINLFPTVSQVRARVESHGDSPLPLLPTVECDGSVGEMAEDTHTMSAGVDNDDDNSGGTDDKTLADMFEYFWMDTNPDWIVSPRDERRYQHLVDTYGPWPQSSNEEQ